ncbi:amino acid/polyamine transporter I [Syncephalastrum racemosum]|uniref:Amino acid/polyamine transporter I n=1 Tax=Syncephalastrum racemosum TaxID=13706 RepID=A0A1X2HJF2_SYNRA|nr:amino acid/polyamine transporter I [Syncephalastrum racemosum]
MQYLAFLNQSNVVWSCAALLFTILVMAIKSPHWNSLEWLVDTYENRTGFESTTYVFMLGMIGAAYSLFGAEGAASTTEETKNADISTPIAMVCSITLSWFIGLVFLLVLLLSLQDIDAILDAKLHIPLAQVFWDTAGKGGAAGFLLFITVSQFCTGTASMTVTSRMLFALARDKATPYSDALRQLDTNKLPTCAVKCVFVSTVLFGILPLVVSESAFDILVSSTTITSNMAYAMVMGCRLITNPSILEKGRFNIGWFSRPATLIAFAWTCFAVFIFMLPTSWPIEFATFNWSGIAGFAVVGVNLCLWYSWGRYHYTGPRASNDETT